MPPESKPRQIAGFNGKWIAHAHTLCASAAFLSAFAVGCHLHYHKIVENEHFGYPDEWFPSVSATIGDRYPERSIFQLLIAVTSGPRFALVALLYLLFAGVENGTKTNPPASASASASALSRCRTPEFFLAVGLLRTFTCGGWVYITSTDDHDIHDIFMISYIVLTLPWDLLTIRLSPRGSRQRRLRCATAVAFFGLLVPLVYFFIRHKVHHVAGAYTIYAFFEWSLIVLDVAFDAIAVYDFAEINVAVVGGGVALTAVSGSSVASSASAGSGKPFVASFSGFFLSVLAYYLFWTVFTAVPLLIWFFPLWNMGISGFEAVVALNALPFVLAIPKFVSFVVPKSGKLFSIMTLCGVGSYLVAQPEYRLLLTGIGSGIGCVALAVDMWRSAVHPEALLQNCAAFSLGLAASATAKYAVWTNNPLWPIMNAENGGCHSVLLLLALAGLMWFKDVAQPEIVAQETVSRPAPRSSATSAALGLGAAVYGLHAMLSDSSTMILWVWRGFPIRGPLAVPHGAITIAVMCGAAYYATIRPETAMRPIPFALGCIGAAGLYLCSGWLGYGFGLLYAAHLVAVVPGMVKTATRHSPAVFGGAMLVWILLTLAHVWVVAYAFVPAGWLLRERSDLLLVFTSAGIACGVRGYWKEFGTVASTKPQTDSKFKLPKPDWRFPIQAIRVIALCITFSAATIAFLRFPTADPIPNHPDTHMFTAGIWTIHFGLDNDMWASEVRMRDLIRDLELDVVGLLESDTQRIIMGNRDITQRIAEDLGMYADFGPGPNQHTWGAALLSKFPIIRSEHHLLPSPVGELAPAIHATLDVFGELVDIVVFHSGQEEDVEDRRLQSEGVAQIMASSERPLVLLSYLVTKPLQGNYNTYVSEFTRMKDVDASDWDRWCEYILYRGLKRVGYARVSRGSITDTEVQAAKFIVNNEENVVPGAKFGEAEAGIDGVRVAEEDVKPEYRFPAVFRGDGIRGHRFHVFKEPRYFAYP